MPIGIDTSHSVSCPFPLLARKTFELYKRIAVTKQFPFVGPSAVPNKGNNTLSFASTEVGCKTESTKGSTHQMPNNSDCANYFSCMAKDNLKQ
eukprot:6629-Karenia_brevis.AAC.1